MYTHPDSLAACLEAFLAAWSPRQQAAAHALLGRTITSAQQLLASPFTNAPLDPAVHTLLQRVDRTWPACSPRLVATLEQALRDPLLIAGNHARGWLLNPVRLCQWMQPFGSDSVAGWCTGHSPGHAPETLLRFWHASAADRLTMTCDQPDSWPHRAARFELTLPTPDPDQVAAAGQKIRAFVISDLALAAEDCHPITRRFFDVPDPDGSGWACVQPFGLVCDDVRLVEAATASLELPGPTHALHTWWAQQLDPESSSQPMADLPFTSDPLNATRDWESLRDRIREAQPRLLTARAMIDHWMQHPLVPTRAADTTDLLTDHLAENLDAVPWTWVIDAAVRPDTPAVIDRLLDTDVDWTDFDSPGEGSLPLWWWRALMLSGERGVQTRLRLESVDSALVGHSRQPADAWFASFVSLRASGEWVRQTSQNPLSSYTHGLQDAVAEAYGDVWSRADPFSIRRPETSDD